MILKDINFIAQPISIFRMLKLLRITRAQKSAKTRFFNVIWSMVYEGNADYGEIGGVEYYLGDDTGISHYFVDEQVQNGRTYYYALVAYDYGAPNIGDGISPTENNIILELDEAEEVIRTGINVAVVTPHQKAAGLSGSFND